MIQSNRSDSAPPAPISPTAAGSAAAGPGPRGALRALLGLFSSVWLGISLLALLFTYSVIGSSGLPSHWNVFEPAAWENAQVRLWRGFEMTEFEWFNWWPFDLLIALICVTLVVATLRRIRFNAINLGVWMIHTGIIVLCLGSVWYFGTKVEGDAPISRRQVMIEAPGLDQPVAMIAQPGNSAFVGSGDNAYSLQIAQIDPQWELLSGDDKGARAYKVSVMVQSKAGQFMRELIAGRPEYTQDLVRSNDPSQPFVRAVKTLGKPLVDEALRLSLDYVPQQFFYLKDSRALYLREAGQSEWVSRPIAGLPRYNDYIASFDDVWPGEGVTGLRPQPIDVEVPAVAPDDPLPDVTFRISRFLRYAGLETRRNATADGPLNPAVTVRLDTRSGSAQHYELAAFDEEHSSALEGGLHFAWANTAQELEAFKRRREPAIRFSVPGTSIAVEKTIADLTRIHPDLAFEPIEGTEYAYRVQAVQDGLTIGDKTMSVAIVEIKSPQRTYTRWVFDDPARNRDMAMAEGVGQHGADIPLDAGIETVYRAGENRAPITLVAGPGETDLGLVITRMVGQPSFMPVKPGDSLPIASEVSLQVQKYAARTVQETRPVVVPRGQREGDVGENMSLIKLEAPASGAGVSTWLPYHMFPFNSPGEVLRRFPYRPQIVTLADGRKIEMMFSRERLPLPAAVVLEDFQVESHIGGFTGQASSIMDWISLVRFAEPDRWGDLMAVRVNKPAECRGMWFFQAQWDPPDPPRAPGDTDSRGLNYTVLGVGNRNGVHVQLAGCVLAVLGMIYTFYARPVIKRRRQQAVYVQAAATSTPGQKSAERPAAQPVGAAWKVQS